MPSTLLGFVTTTRHFAFRLWQFPISTKTFSTETLMSILKYRYYLNKRSSMKQGAMTAK